MSRKSPQGRCGEEGRFPAFPPTALVPGLGPRCQHACETWLIKHRPHLVPHADRRMTDVSVVAVGKGKPARGGPEGEGSNEPQPERRTRMCRFHRLSSVSGKSVRKWEPRVSSRAVAPAMINWAVQSMFCNSQPTGLENWRGKT